MLLLSLLTLAVLQEAVVVHSLSSFDPDIPDLSMVQYNIAILGGPSVTHVNVVFSVWDLEIARSWRAACG